MQSNESIISKLCDPPKSFRTQHQVQNETQFRKKPKNFKMKMMK